MLTHVNPLSKLSSNILFVSYLAIYLGFSTDLYVCQLDAVNSSVKKTIGVVHAVAAMLGDPT